MDKKTIIARVKQKLGKDFSIEDKHSSHITSMVNSLVKNADKDSKELEKCKKGESYEGSQIEKFFKICE